MLIFKKKILKKYFANKKFEILLTFGFGNHYTHIIHFSEFKKLIFIIYILNLYFRILYFSNVNFPIYYMQNFNGLALIHYQIV